MATVRVTRPSGGFRDSLRAYRISLDERDVGSLRRGQSLDVTTTPGPHRLQASLGYLLVGNAGSEPLEITVTDETVAEYIVRPLGAPIIKPGDVRYRRSSYLELVPTAGPSRPDS